MTDIATQAVTWSTSGGRRVAAPQYIQTAIDAGSAGDTYVLLTGTHRGQTFQPKNGDTMELAAGAIMDGGEDIGTGSWTNEGGGRWSKATTLPAGTHQTGNLRTGYQGYVEAVIVDGVQMSFKTTTGAVDANSAHYDGTLIHIGVDPSGVSEILMARPARVFTGASGVSNVTIKGNAATPGRIRNYAPGVQSENAALAVSRNSNPIAGATGWIVQDLEIYNMYGMGVALGDSATLRRCDVHDIGQVGIGSSNADDWIVEYCRFYRNAYGSWAAGWEAANSKFAVSLRGIIRGCRWVVVQHPNGQYLTPFWCDIDNDGFEIYDNDIIDWSTAGGLRGLFWEISYSAKIHHNVLYRLCRDSENDGWAKGINASASGATGSTHFATLEINENLLYDCYGGIGGVQQDRGSGLFGTYLVQNLDVHDNVTYFTGDATWTEEIGIVDFDTTLPPANSSYDDNLYLLPTSAGTNNFRNDMVGGSGDSLNFASWQSAPDNLEASGVVIQTTTHPATDPDPYNGGCMVGAM